MYMSKPVRSVSQASSKKSRSFFARVSRHVKKTTRKVLLSPTFQKTARNIMVGIIVVISLYGIMVYAKKALQHDVVVSKGEIIDRVSQHTTLPKGDPTSVVRVQDASRLQQQNAFYKDVSQGDYVIVFSSQVIIYNLREDRIVASMSPEIGR